MTAKDSSSSSETQEALPFGALPEGKKRASATAKKKKPVRRKTKASRTSRADDSDDEPEAKNGTVKKRTTKKKAAKKTTKKAASRKKPVSRKKAEDVEEAPVEVAEAPPAVERERERERDSDRERDRDRESNHDDDGPRRRRTRRGRRRRRSEEDGEAGENAESNDDSKRDDGPRNEAGRDGGHGSERGEDRPRKRRRRRGRRGRNRDGDSESSGGEGEGQRQRPARDTEKKTGTGMFILDKGQVSVLRLAENQFLPSKQDIYVPKKLVQQFKLRDGMMVEGPLSRGYKHKFQLDGVDSIDGQEPRFWKNKPQFKNLTSIDPDFHYAVGDVTDDVAMRMVDLISPIGRGQRGLLVAPPRSGKTTLMRQFAAGIEKGYPDVHLMVLLIDERPEEATEWQRSIENGQVFVSTADQTAKNHITLAELVWRRAMRLVEMGEDVVILLDSITRLARAYNNQAGSGRTMSGGLDSRAMERPRKIFGSARNTVEAGSLTILGTTLVETGSRMDQLVFEEFKGTGNMELVLNRKLADRRIFPAIDIERSGTRKEEKLVGLRRLKSIHILRRVLSRMHFAEAADLLITRLDDVAKTDDFLERFTVDPEA